MHREGDPSSSEPHARIESKEQERFVELGRITLLRHGQTEYTDEYPDLTAEGTATIEKSAAQIAKGLRHDEEPTIVSSDKARARGTADIIKEKLGYPKDVKIQPSMSAMELRDQERAKAIFEELLAENKSAHSEEAPVRGVDRAYLHDQRFEDATIYEPRSEVEKRFFRNLEYTIRAFNVVRKHEELQKPHIIGVSHFELLGQLSEQVFNLTERGEEPLKHGELIEIEVLAPEERGEDIVELQIFFRGEQKRVGFDRHSRTLLIGK